MHTVMNVIGITQIFMMIYTIIKLVWKHSVMQTKLDTKFLLKSVL